MKTLTSAKITFTGTNNGISEERGNLKLAQQRAQNVKDYLVNVWGIDPSRITTKNRNLPTDPSGNTTTEGQAENRRVEMTTTHPALFDPTSRSELEKSINLSSIKFLPIVTADAGIKSWKLLVTQGGYALFEEQGKVSIPKELLWKLESQRFSSTDDPVEYKLSVIDNESKSDAHRSSTIMKQLTIEKKKAQRIGNEIVTRSGLVVFDFDKADLSPRNIRIIDEIKKSITPNSRVKIIGYTDKLGDPQHNLDLSLRRAQAVQKALGNVVPASNIIVEGRGGEKPLYSGETPEDRFFSRMVEVITEAPAE